MDGSRRPVDNYANCNWGRAPSQAIVTSSAKTSEQKRFYQKFIQVNNFFKNIYLLMSL